jgi:dolichol-phosphate mannosyltransferase
VDKFSVVVPCFNEEENLPYLFGRLNLLKEELIPRFQLQFVFVNDGSTDQTLKLLENASFNGCETLILNHKPNRGVGEGIRTGFKGATGDFIATIDADCSYDPMELIEMLKLYDDETDIIIASPYHPDGSVKDVPKFRLFLSQNVSRLYRFVLGLNIYTYTSIFRIYRNNVIGRIDFKDSGFYAIAEILVDAAYKGCRIKEYPAELRGRKYGKSKLNFGKEIKNHSSFLLRSMKKRIFLRA